VLATPYYSSAVKTKLLEILQVLRKDPLPSISEEAALLANDL
jgi:hypothetical protein